MDVHEKNQRFREQRPWSVIFITPAPTLERNILNNKSAAFVHEAHHYPYMSHEVNSIGPTLA